MLPTTISAARKLAGLLTASSAIESGLTQLAREAQIDVPVLYASDVRITSVPAGVSDLEQPLAYPRVSIFSNKVKNTQTEKFRSLSGSATVVAEIAATSDLAGDVDVWIHFYVEAISTILRQHQGDWGDGFFFAGGYEVEILPPQAGGCGFLQLARLYCEINVSSN